jgi:hypothetical protein
MRSATLSVCILAAGLFLAGCTEPSTSNVGTSSSEPPLSGPAVVDENTGSIEGRVLDSEFLPLKGAIATIPSLDRSAVADINGRFVLNGINPGSHVLEVHRLGYESRAVTVSVQAGVITPLQIELQSLATQDPYPLTLMKNGIAGCFVAYRASPANINNGNVYCGRNETTLPQQHRLWWSPIDPAGWNSSVFEMTWDSTQLLGKGLEAKLYLPACGDIARDLGESPLRGVGGPAAVAEFSAALDDKCAPECNAVRCGLQTWVGAVAATLGSSVPVDVGYVWQQGFQQYHTVFYWGQAPDGFSALPDE